MSNNEYLVFCLNNNQSIHINKPIYFFDNINMSMTFAQIKSIRYFNKHVSHVDTNITFTAIITSDVNIKKYKRKFFYMC